MCDLFCRNDFSTPWYHFSEQRAGVRALKTEEVSPFVVVNISPVWTDGILGEISWRRPEWAVPTLDAKHHVELCLQLNAYDSAWRSGDLDARLATIEDKTCNAIRVIEVNGERRYRAVARTKSELRSAWSSSEAGRVLELQRLHQGMTTWYAFAAYRMLLELPDRESREGDDLCLARGTDRKVHR